MDDSQASLTTGPHPAITGANAEKPNAPAARPSARRDARPGARLRQLLVAPAVLAILGVGFASTVVDTRNWAVAANVERLGRTLAMGTVAMALLGTWLAYTRFRDERSVLWSRIAIATPCLYWASQGISSSFRLAESADRQAPSAIRLGAGVVGLSVLVCDLIRRRRPLVRSFSAGLLLSIGSVASIGLAMTLGLSNQPDLQLDIRRFFAAVLFPALLVGVGLLLILSDRSPHPAVRRCLGVAMLLLSLAQIVAPPGLVATDAKLAAAAGGAGLASALVLLVGLGFDLQRVAETRSGRLVAAELEASQSAERLEAERLLTSRRDHDQKAALLSIEAVIKLLESSEAIDPAARRRLCDAATEELRRLRGNSPHNVETDLRELVEPVVALANASGAKVSMKVRPGLVVTGGPELVDVIRNLISNAVRHGGNADVTIEARRLDHEFVELCVSDAGRGIRSDRRFDLFEPGRTSGGEESSGLGLHSARSVLRDIGGDLVLDRGFAGGARFVARIPTERAIRPASSA